MCQRELGFASRNRCCWLVLLGLLVPCSALSAPTSRAVLVVEPALLESGVLGPLVHRLSSDWLLLTPQDLPFIAAPDPGCRGDSDAAQAMVSLLDDGMRLYFEDTDLPGASATFLRAFEALERVPCALAERPADRDRMGVAGLLLIRMAMHAGQSERAEALARRFCARLGADEAARADVPPDVQTFVAGVRRTMEADVVPLRLFVRNRAGGGSLRLLVDGIRVGDGSVEGEAAWGVMPGWHTITVQSEGGQAWTRRVEVADAGLDLAIDLDLSRLFEPLDSWPGVTGEDSAALARLAVQARATVLFVDRLGDGSVRVEAIPAGDKDFQGEVLHVKPGRDQADTWVVEVPGRAGPRRTWAWPWVTGVLSAGLLSGGIALNVQANRDAQAITNGSNRLEDQRLRRAGSIACYSLAAASAVSTVLLGVLRPRKAETLAVVPLDGGVAVGVVTTF